MAPIAPFALIWRPSSTVRPLPHKVGASASLFDPDINYGGADHTLTHFRRRHWTL